MGGEGGGEGGREGGRLCEVDSYCLHFNALKTLLRKFTLGRQLR